MTDNQFDELFRTRLEDHASKVPDDMWERINKKDKDRRIFFFLRWQMLLLLLFIGLGGTYFLVQKNNMGIAENSTAQHLETVNKEKNNIQQNENKTILQNNAADTAQSNEAQISQLNTAKPSKKINQQSAKQVDNMYKKYNQQNDATNNADTIKDIKITNGFNDITGNYIAPSDSLKDILVNTNGPSKKDSVEANDTEEKRDPDNDESYSDKFFIELYASPDLPLNYIAAENSLYEQALKDAGKMQLAYTFGVRLGIKINKNLSGKIGVQYAQINEKMNFIDSIMSVGDVSYNNRYKSVDIPLLISYTKKWQANLSVSFSTGILLNISSTYKGAIPDASGDAVNINSQNVYKKNTGVSLYAAIGFSKEINNKTDLFAEPYFRYRIPHISSSIQLFDQKINTVGISLGVRYRLFKAEKDQ